MREDQMSKLDRGLVTFSAVGARKSRGGKPTQILTDQLTLYQIMPTTLYYSPQGFSDLPMALSHLPPGTRNAPG